MDSTQNLRAAAVTVEFTKNSPVLENVSIEIVPGQMIGLVGLSGSGKTTLARLLAGKMSPTLGKVLMDSQEVSTQRGHRNPDIATINQSPRDACSPRWKIKDIIAEPLRVAGKLDEDAIAARVNECADEALVDATLLDRLPHQVSDGQLQRACIARALAQAPRFLICDEPTSMLDPLATAAVVSLLRRQADSGVGVLLISHDHRLLAACADTVLEMDQLKKRN